MPQSIRLALAVCLVSGCALELDEPDTSVDETQLIAANKLAANKLAANKLAASSLQTKQLMDTADGREVMSFIVGCALPTGQSLTLTTTAGASYTYPGWLNLAPAWTTRVPTVTERRWVTACLLARTNMYGVQVNISMRHDTNPALATTIAERNQYSVTEGGFFGDLFGTQPLMYACAARTWTPQAPGASYRACALSENGTTTDCGFTYAGNCNRTAPSCTDTTAPFGNCNGAGVTYAEVITIFLTPTQQQGQTQ